MEEDKNSLNRFNFNVCFFCSYSYKIIVNKQTNKQTNNFLLLSLIIYIKKKTLQIIHKTLHNVLLSFTNYSTRSLILLSCQSLIIIII